MERGDGGRWLAEAEVHGEDGDFYGADEGVVGELDGEGDLGLLGVSSGRAGRDVP